MRQRVTEEKKSMESSQEQDRLTDEASDQKGGIRTMPFIIVNESFERVASYGLLPNMIFYLMKDYHMSAATGSSLLSFWSALSNFLAIAGAYVSDSYLGRFRVITLGSISSLLGTSMLWLTAVVPHAKPAACDPSSTSCESATLAQVAILLISFGLISIGAGCIRPCSIAFGADQFAKGENPSKEKSILESYFNWYYASIGMSTILALTVVVYIQERLGWIVGFGVPAILMFLSALFFLVGSSLYVKVKVTESVYTGLVQVLVAAFKKRHLALPPENSEALYHYKEGSKLVIPSDGLRCLNKACIIRDTDEDLIPDGSASKPWELCTVDQVEALKSLIKTIPIWSTGVGIFFVISPSSVPVLQAKTMDRHITSFFEIPTGSFTLFTVITVTIWVAFYDRIVSPLLAKYTRSGGLSPMTRMGAGLLFACLAMAVAAVVESIRRKTAIEEGFAEDPTAVLNMSAMWLVPQFCLTGLAEGLNAIGQVEFFYSQLPKSMSSLAMAIFTVGMAVASLLTGVIVSVIDRITSNGGNVSWLASNINKGHCDYYYGFLCFLGLLNFFYFLVCCRALGPSQAPHSSMREDLKERLLSKSRESPGSSSV